MIKQTLSVLPEIARSRVDGRPIRITCDMDQHVILSSVRRALANDTSKSCFEIRTIFKLAKCNSYLSPSLRHLSLAFVLFPSRYSYSNLPFINSSP